MIKRNSFKLIHKIGYIILFLWITNTTSAQVGSFGNTFAFESAEVSIHEKELNFQIGTLGVLPGIVGTERTNQKGYVSFYNTTSWLNATNTSYVDGYVKTYNTGPFIFPIGDNNRFRPAAVSTATESLPSTAAYYAVNPSVAVTSSLKGGNEPILPTGNVFLTTNKSKAVYLVDTTEYWDIDGLTPAKISLTWNENTSKLPELTNNKLSNLIIVGWDGSQWVEIPSSFDATNILTGSSSLSSGSITTRSTISPSSYTVYTLGSKWLNPKPDSGIVSYKGGIAISNIVINDSINGNNAAIGTTANVTIRPSGLWPAGFTLDSNTGSVIVANTVSPGKYMMVYTICDKLSPTFCDVDTIYITVIGNIKTIVKTAFVYEPYGGTAFINVIKGDSVNGKPAVLGANCTLSPSGTWPVGITIDPLTGKVTVAPGTKRGTYSLSYILCDTTTPRNCATQQIVIKVIPITPDTTVVTLGTTNPSASVCTNQNDLDTSVGKPVYSTCGTPAGYRVVGPDAYGCYTYTLDSTAPIPTTDMMTCQVICVNGICDTTYVILKKPTIESNIPNYFSPNGDGKNDKFDLSSITSKYPNSKLIIYNRWGNIVWRSVGPYKNDWDGTNYQDGLPLPDGVYYWMIEREPEMNKVLTGFIELMRE